MPKQAFFMAVLALGVPLPALAEEPATIVTDERDVDESDDALRQAVTKSPIVLVGQVASAPEQAVAGEGELPAATTWGFTLKVDSVLKGTEKREQLRVEITQLAGREPPKLGDKSVFFLRPLYPDQKLDDPTNPLVSSDNRFGMQPTSPSLLAAVNRAATDAEAKPPADGDLRLRFKGFAPDDGGALMEVLNQTDKPILYSGYTADSFDPPLPKGTVFPLSKIELQQDGKWTDSPIGYCGFGVGPVTFLPNEPVTFKFMLPAGNWTALRVGVRRQKGEGPEEWETVWSRKLFRSVLVK